MMGDACGHILFRAVAVCHTAAFCRLLGNTLPPAMNPTFFTDKADRARWHRKIFKGLRSLFVYLLIKEKDEEKAKQHFLNTVNVIALKFSK